MLSTTHNASVVPTGKRDRQGNITKRTEVINEFNKYMGAVDWSDQMVGYGSFRRITLKWWKKVLFYVFRIALLNSWILCRECCSQHQQNDSLQRVFRRDFVKCLIADVQATPAEVSIPRRKPRTGLEGERRLRGRHFPSKVVPIAGTKRQHPLPTRAGIEISVFEVRRWLVRLPLFHVISQLLPRPRRGLRGIVFTRSVCVSVSVSVCLCVQPIFWYFIYRLLEEIAIWNVYRILIGLYSIHWK